MDLTNCPLQSFAVCTRNKDKDRARIEKANKDYAYASKGNKFHNRGTSYLRGKSRNVIGFSRAKSDIQSKAKKIQGKGRQLKEEAVRAYAIKSSVATEGGRSRTAGRNDYLALLAKQARIESKISSTLGEGQASAMQGITRQYQNKEASNREKLGLPPEYGPRVTYRKRGLFDMIAPLSSIASIATPFMV